MFFDLRRDINNIFDVPFVSFADPLEELLDMRSRMIDAFDNHLPVREDNNDDKTKALGSGGEKEKEKENEDGKEGKEIVKGKEEVVRGNKNWGITRRPVGVARQWVPRCDIHEDEKEFVVHAEIPGLKKEDIKLEFNPETHVMIISGERKDVREQKKETEKGGYHCVECNYGSFSRSFRVPKQCWTKLDEMNAKCVDGVLEVHCPKDEAKTEEKKVKTIEIK
jgi:HSP20 family protein